MARRIMAARVKANRSYTVEELADTVHVTPQTVRGWIKRGLPALTGQRPFLVLGWACKEFLAGANSARKRPLDLGEFFCLGCKCPRGAAMGMADYEPLLPGRGLLRAFCKVCERSCTRVIGSTSLPAWKAICRIGGTNPEQD
jgi:hypothetical protein